MASAVVTIGPEPEKLAMRRAAAHTVVERVILKIILSGDPALVRRGSVGFVGGRRTVGARSNECG
jgi:hypothetical protein